MLAKRVAYSCGTPARCGDAVLDLVMVDRMKLDPAAHTLILTSREDHLYDAKCSCDEWTMKKQRKSVIRESHDEHVQEHLGPEAKS